jgi:formylglycine-generating enzyme required for sulfatase activity
MKFWAWGAITGVIAGAGFLIYALDSDGIIDVEKFFGGDGLKNYSAPRATKSNIEDLRKRVLDNMVYIPGGSFKFGNVPVPVILDGEERRELIYGPVVDADRAPVTIDSYYLSRFEITNYDFDLYAAANDLPLRGDAWEGHERQGPYPAVIAYHQAEGFCAWVSEVTGQPFDLPTSKQWEFAARSGGRDVAYATQDGTYDYLAKLYHETLDQQPHTTHLPDAYPPNPYGIYAMSSNLREWVKDTWLDTNGFPLAKDATPDPEAGDRRVWRGSGHGAQASLNSVFMLGAAGPTTKTRAEEYRHLDAFFEPDRDVIYHDYETGVRCVINLGSPPDVSGFGHTAGQVPDNYPKAFVPLERR